MENNPALAECKNLLYLGAHQAAINKLNNLVKTSSGETQIEAKLLLIRAYLAQGKYNSASNECQNIRESAYGDLQAAATNLTLYLQARYQSGKTEMLPALVADCHRNLKENENSITNPIFVYLTSALLLHAGEYEEAMKLLALHPENIECFALMVQAYLAINRSDMAEQLCLRTKKLFEDSVIYQLCEAWTCCYSAAGAKADRAFYTFEELSLSSTGTSISLLVSQAVSKLHMGQYPEADGILLEALDKDNNNGNVLSNLAISSVLNDKDSYKNYVNQLREQNPHHPFIADIDEKASLFDSAAKVFE
ncbi:Coatomer subunit epsilon [Smittium mucronatum]|uniref:Coatomer subunit epsilon n=1 Tax=Smittium mucronatum TaxID=133383 RepID=A0A1R0GMM5_9FUNG|nr:Coatomer subunit epsilon [Smittium mucronatum]